MKKGQSLLEFAITLPLMVMIVFGVLDLGRLYFTHIAMEDGVGEAALYVSINPDCVTADSGEECSYPDNALDRAKESIKIPFVNIDDSNLTVECFVDDVEINCEDASPGDVAKVTMSYDYQFLTPLLRKVNSLPTITLESEATTLILVP